MASTNQECFDFIRRAYKPLLELGRGGMAKVYLAESLTSGLKKLVVLKILNRELAAETEIRSAFLREAELAARMNHPNVVQVLEVVEHASTPVIVMEYLDGISLSEVLSRADRKLSLPLHVYILVQVLTGLHYFHELNDYDGTPLNPVHRDVSPQNVLVLHDGLVKVVDFGIAKINATQEPVTRTGIIKGKINYMPPEQLFNEPEIDRRADVFAVGVMLWEAVAHRRMWEGITQPQLLRMLAVGDIPDLRDIAPDAPEELIWIVERALAHDRDDRYPTAREMQYNLEQWLRGHAEYVNVRSLADFMLEHFGDVRQSHARTVRGAMRNPSAALGVLDCETRPRPLSVRPGPVEPGTEDPQIVTHTFPDRPIALVRSKRGLGVIALALTMAAGAVWISWRGAHKPTSLASAASATTKMVELTVEARPPSSEIYLDGKHLGRGRYRGSHPATESKSWIEVRATGYVDERREIVLNRDTALDISLHQMEPADVASSTVNSASKPTSARRGGTSRFARGATAAPAPSSSNRAAPKPAGCEPPYTFSSDGVKTYKPECF